MDQSVYQTYQIKPVVARVESSIRSLSSWQQDFVILRQEIGIQMFEAKAKVKRQQTEIGLESQRLQAELSLKSQRLEREIEDLNHLEKTMVEELIEAAGERIEKLKMMARLANQANKEIATKDFPVTAEQWPEKRKLVVNPPAALFAQILNRYSQELLPMRLADQSPQQETTNSKVVIQTAKIQKGQMISTLERHI